MRRILTANDCASAPSLDTETGPNRGGVWSARGESPVSTSICSLARGGERLLQPEGDGVANQRADLFVLQRRVLVGFARRRGNEQVVDARHLDVLDWPGLLSLGREGFK